MRLLAVAVIAVAALTLAVSAPAEDAAKIEKGKEVYAAAKPNCKVCHAIGGVGNAKGALDAVGSTLKAEEIKAWIRTPKEMAVKAKAARKPPMPVFGPDKIADADLEALVAYLCSLTKK
jgi:mono/diheme cytochrome c family protein